MIYDTPQQIALYYGAPFVSLKQRFNSDHSTAHKNDAFKYEFGYIQGRCIYAIIQKTTGNGLTQVEVMGRMAINGSGAWKLMTALDPQKDGPALQKIIDNRAVNLGYIYTPVAQDAFYPKQLLASHQLNRTQLVIYHPIWQVDLSQIEADPI